LRPSGVTAGHTGKPYKETDLIYEGIATPPYFVAIVLTGAIKETDLIYEGIATVTSLSFARFCPGKETDLIYEGIATCLVGSVLFFINTKETDLIYEGIATFNVFCVYPILKMPKKLT